MGSFGGKYCMKDGIIHGFDKPTYITRGHHPGGMVNVLRRRVFFEAVKPCGGRREAACFTWMWSKGSEESFPNFPKS